MRARLTPSDLTPEILEILDELAEYGKQQGKELHVVLREAVDTYRERLEKIQE